MNGFCDKPSSHFTLLYKWKKYFTELFTNCVTKAEQTDMEREMKRASKILIMKQSPMGRTDVGEFSNLYNTLGEGKK